MRHFEEIRTFWLKADEVPKVVVSRLSLGDFVMWLRLYGMNEVWELHRVLNEEHRNIVSNNIPIPFLRVKFDREAADIANSVLASKFNNHWIKLESVD